MKKRAIQYALIFFIAGIIVTAFMGYLQRRTIGTFEEKLPYLTLGETLKYRVVRAQLNANEISRGDATVSFDNDVLSQLTSAQALLQGAYDGKTTDIGTFRKSKDEDIRAIIKESIMDVEKLISIARESNTTLSAIPDSVMTTAISQLEKNKLNSQFDQVQSSIDRLITAVNAQAIGETATFKILSWLSLFLLAVLFVGLGYVLYRHKEKSDRMVQDNFLRIEQQEKSVSSLSTFIESISAGNFSVELNLEGENNLSSILLQMRDKLRENADNDRKRNWSTSGLAQIGEILRANSTGIVELYDNILRFVVKYTKSNQGGLFLLNEENEADKHIELVACYAFERKKYLQKKVVIGEGLIGQCYLEGEKIYLVEVPQEYITITSGLGGSNPNALLIVPLKVNEKIYGVLELATFGKYEDYEIELVEKLAETIASTISAVRINESTRILLEKTQQQAEEMRAQEEEMRQNMEELEATQEEMRRKEKHIEVMLDAEKQRNEFNNAGRQVVIDLSKSKDLLDGKWDESLEKITKSVGEHLRVSKVSVYSYDEIMNQLVCDKVFNLQYKNFTTGAALSARDYPEFLAAVKSEKIIVAKDALTHPDTKVLTYGFLVPNKIKSMLNLPFLSEGKIAGIISCEQQVETDWSDDHVEFLKSCADLLTVTKNTVRINSMVLNLSEAQETLQTIIDNLPRAVFWKDRDLRIQGCNRIFASVAGLKSHVELIGKTDFDMPWRAHADAYRADDLHVMNTRISRIDQEEKNVNSEGKESWVLTSKVPVLNKEGEVVAVLGMFEDITDRKQKEAELNLKLKELQHLKTMLEKQKN
jgi:PAS domain S-box-containing protein